MIFGYARGSTPEQNLKVQLHLLRKGGCEKIHIDVASEVRSNRKGLNELIKYMCKGNTVVAYKNDSVFRSLKNMVELIDKFNKAGVYFKSLSEPEFDTKSANGKFLLQIFAAVAEFERNPIGERTKVGFENARRRNKLLGRPKGYKKETIEKYHFAKYLYDNKNLRIKIACSRAQISKPSFYRVEKTL